MTATEGGRVPWQAQAAREAVSLTPEQALRVARSLWPEHEWHAGEWAGMACAYERAKARWVPDDPGDLAAAERALVARGLGEQYGRELATLLRTPESTYGRTWSTSGEQIAAIRTAPFDVIARAILRTIEAAEAGPEDA